MKNSIRTYGIIWAICLAVFNVIVFVTPKEIAGVNKFDGSFWVGYIFISVAFVGQLVCSVLAFREGNLKKLFYKIPLVSISYTGLVLMLVSGGVFMAVHALPKWLGIIVCFVVLAFNAIAVIKANAASDIVGNIDEKIQVKTSFMKNISVDAQVLLNSVKSDELRVFAKKVYEAIRYSDAVSNPEIQDLEAEIKEKFNEFEKAVKSEDIVLSEETSNVLLETIDKRNQKIKLLKSY